VSWYPDRIPDWFSGLIRGYLWHGDRETRSVYVTFDDGPTPEVTSFILNQLEPYEFKATFFLIGDCVQRCPDLKDKIIGAGHSLGNHTYHHLNSWKTATDVYVENVRKASELIDSHLFRPPYGRIKRAAARRLRDLGYQIVLWDVLSADFDQNRSAKSCLQSLIKNTKNGSVIVFHDSIKAFPILQEILPDYLKWLKQQKFSCKVL
jgi:peptidoglycan/xylan/chitin deacetylase (PgdA/CDA1 family)